MSLKTLAGLKHLQLQVDTSFQKFSKKGSLEIGLQFDKTCLTFETRVAPQHVLNFSAFLLETRSSKIVRETGSKFSNTFIQGLKNGGSLTDGKIKDLMCITLSIKKLRNSSRFRRGLQRYRIISIKNSVQSVKKNTRVMRVTFHSFLVMTPASS